MRAKICEAMKGCRKHQFESISRRDELRSFEDGFDYEICKLARSQSRSLSGASQQALVALRFKLRHLNPVTAWTVATLPQ